MATFFDIMNHYRKQEKQFKIGYLLIYTNPYDIVICDYIWKEE